VKKRPWFLTLAVCLTVLFALGCLLVFSHRPEPIINGKPESFWVNGLPANFQEIAGLGSNAVPVLLKAIERRQDPITRTYRDLWPKLPGWIQRRWPRPVDAPALRKAAAAMLSRMADHKVLIAILKNNPDPEVRLWVIMPLMQNSERPITLALIEALQDKDTRVREVAMAGLATNDRDIKPAIPALIKCLRDKVPAMRWWAVKILGSQPAGIEAALPELKRALKDPDKRVRDAATEALK